MHSIWTGSLSFSLINIPVQLYSATHATTINLDMLHEKDHGRIRYSRICELENKEVPYKEIVKGYPYQKGDYVILTEEDLERAHLEKSKTIEILSFVKEAEVDPIYFEKPYFLEPAKGGSSVYNLLREALKHSKKIAIASFILAHREHLAVIKPYKEALILNQLYYQDEISDITKLKIPSQEKKFKEREMQLALQLIEKWTEKFDPSKYHDPYVQEMEKIIEEKISGKKAAKQPSKESKVTPIGDLMSKLKASLKEPSKKTKQKPAKKKKVS